MDQEHKPKVPIKELPAADQGITLQPVRNGWLVKSNEGWFVFGKTPEMLEHVAVISKNRK